MSMKTNFQVPEGSMVFIEMIGVVKGKGGKMIGVHLKSGDKVWKFALPTLIAKELAQEITDNLPKA